MEDIAGKKEEIFNENDVIKYSKLNGKTFTKALATLSKFRDWVLESVSATPVFETDVVVQDTNEFTPVTINTQAGTIETETNTTAAGDSYSFNVNNSTVTENSIIMVTGYDESGGDAIVYVDQTATIAGRFTVYIKNIGSGAFSGKQHITFLVM